MQAPINILACSLVYLGYKKNLEVSDAWSPNPRDITRNTAPKLEKAWKDELENCYWQVKYYIDKL